MVRVKKIIKNKTTTSKIHENYLKYIKLPVLGIWVKIFGKKKHI